MSTRFPSAPEPSEPTATPWAEQHTSPMPVVPKNPEQPSQDQHTRPLEATEHQATRPIPRNSAQVSSTTGSVRAVASGRLRPGQLPSDLAQPTAPAQETTQHKPISATAAWDSMEPAVNNGRTTRALPSTDAVRARQKQRFGGLQIIPGLFGWFAALAVSTVLMVLATYLGAQNQLALDTGAGQATQDALNASNGQAVWIALVILGLIELVAFLVGGYTAGRMARFSPVAQGFSVWLWSLLGRALASLGALLLADTAGVVPQELTAQFIIGDNLGIGLIALVAVVVVDLLGAILGGLWGTRFHRKVDTWTHLNVLTQ